MKLPGYEPNVPREDESVESALATPAPGENVVAQELAATATPESPLTLPPVVAQGPPAAAAQAPPSTPGDALDSPVAAKPGGTLGLPPLGTGLNTIGAQLTMPIGSNLDPKYLVTLLPTKKTAVKTDFSGSILMIYGPAKIGKSELASQFPTPWFLATEEGHDHLHIYKSSISSWQHYLDTIQALTTIGQEQQLPYKTIVIDTVDLMFDFCLTHYCQMRSIDHPSDEAYGKGWEGLRQEWQKGIFTLVKLGYTVVFISHAKQRKVMMHGIERDVVGPSLANTPSRVVLPSIDYIIYLDYCPVDQSIDGRKMVLRGNDTTMAGDRSGFFTPEINEISYEALAKDFRDNVVPNLEKKHGITKEVIKNDEF